VNGLEANSSTILQNDADLLPSNGLARFAESLLCLQLLGCTTPGMVGTGALGITPNHHDAPETLPGGEETQIDTSVIVEIRGQLLFRQV
jgi:hypothetical protein